MDDVTRLKELLAPVEEDARGLRWAHERPWRVDTHVGWWGELPTIDGHDLSAKLMKQVVHRLVDALDEEALHTGALRIVVGRGRHSLGPGGVLGQVVAGSLGRRAAERGWRLSPQGGVAWILVTHPERAPASATGAWGWGMRLLALGFLVAALVALARIVGGL